MQDQCVVDENEKGVDWDQDFVQYRFGEFRNVLGGQYFGIVYYIIYIGILFLYVDVESLYDLILNVVEVMVDVVFDYG